MKTTWYALASLTDVMFCGNIHCNLPNGATSPPFSTIVSLLAKFIKANKELTFYNIPTAMTTSDYWDIIHITCKLQISVMNVTSLLVENIHPSGTLNHLDLVYQQLLHKEDQPPPAQSSFNHTYTNHRCCRCQPKHVAHDELDRQLTIPVDYMYMQRYYLHIYPI